MQTQTSNANKSISNDVNSIVLIEPSLAAAFMTVEDASAFLNANLFPQKQVRKLLKAGELNGIECGTGHWLVLKSDVIDYAAKIRIKAITAFEESAQKQRQCLDIDNIIDIPATQKHNDIKRLPLNCLYEETPQPDFHALTQEIRFQRIASTPVLSPLSDNNDIKTTSKSQKLSYSIPEVTRTVLTEKIAEKCRKIPIQSHQAKGVNIELSEQYIRLVVNGKSRGKNLRCVLGPLTGSDDHELQHEIRIFIDDYARVQRKLERRPDSEEFRLYSKKILTVGDALNIHLLNNVNVNHGEGSKESILIQSLIKNHLIKPQMITLQNKSEEIIRIMEEPLLQFNPARYKAYMAVFHNAPGTHDKILTRMKSAINYCKNNNLINCGEYFNFHEAVRRISIARHVSIPNEDLRKIGNYLTRDNFSNENIYRNFKLFMSLEMSGSFRTQTTVNLRYSQFDVKNGNVTTTAKGGGKVVIAVTTNMCQLVLEHQKWQKAQGINSDYLFPSPLNEKKCRANFDKHWTDLRVALGFVSTVKIKDKVKRKFQYRLHDFRETLLNRLQDIDDLTLSLLLGQTSTGSVKYYRKAMAENAKRAAVLAEERLEEVMLALNTPP